MLNRMPLVVNDVDIFIKMGVPDYRLDILPELYQCLVSKKDILIADGLKESEITKLQELNPVISDLCHQLTSYCIKETIVQPDFNDNNTLIDSTRKKVTIIDLGEIVISHPFFAYLNFLFVIKNQYGLEETSEVYLRLKEHCFKMFDINTERLNKALEIAQKLFFVYAALCNNRLQVACDDKKFTGAFSRHGRICPPLRKLLTIF